MKKYSLLFFLFVFLFQFCNQNKDVGTIEFDATIYFSNVDFLLKDSYGKTLDITVKFPREYKDINNRSFSEKDLEIEKNGSVSTEFKDKIQIKSDSIIGRVPFQWIIYDYSIRHIINDSLFVLPDNETREFILFDISKVQIAESEWHKSGNNATHTIWIKNDANVTSWFKVDSIEFKINYYSESEVKLEEKTFLYSGVIPLDETTELTIKIPGLKNTRIINSSSLSINKIYYSKNRKST